MFTYVWFSKIFETVGRVDMGLKFVRSDLQPLV